MTVPSAAFTKKLEAEMPSSDVAVKIFSPFLL
jgi:hypothetical protein